MKPTTITANTIHLLSVEDNVAQQYLIANALTKVGGKYSLASVGDGDEALYYLRNEGKYVSAPRPALVLLDINLPKKSGIEVLQTIRQEESLRRIPVMVLSSSESEEDKRKCHSLCVKAFVIKPSDLDGYSAVIEVIEKVCEEL